jgi:hypothetical protein
MQILEFHPQALVEGSFPVTIHHFQDIESRESEAEERSFDLLTRCLAGVSRLYIVVDTSLINTIVNDNITHANAFLTRLQLILSSRPGGGVKIVLASWRSMGGQNDQQHQESTHQIYVDGPFAGLSRRRLNRSSRLLSIGQTTLRRSLH